MSSLESILLKEYGESYYEKITDGYKTDRYVTLRINNLKSTKEKVIAILEEKGISYEEVHWYPMALVILDGDKKDIENLDIYLNGEIYLQSLSSMLPPFFMDLKSGEQVLDMAASPGGKTSLMQALTNNSLMITAVEKKYTRMMRLRYNLELQGVKKVTVLNSDARFLDDFFLFDKVLLDAPCSGSGTIGLKELDNFKCDTIDSYAKRQKELLLSAIKHVKCGGLIVYSTCSILKEENEEVIKYVLDNCSNVELVGITNLDEFGIDLLPSTIDGVVTVSPSKYYEGFFVAVLCKK